MICKFLLELLCLL